MPIWLIVVLSISGYIALALTTTRICLSYEYADTKRLVSDDYALAGMMGAFWWITAIVFGAYLIGTRVLKPVVTPAAAKADEKKRLAELDKRNEMARAGELGLPFPVTRYDPDSSWYND